MSNKSKMAPTVGGKPIQKIGNCKAHKKSGRWWHRGWATGPLRWPTDGATGPLRSDGATARAPAGHVGWLLTG